MSQFLTCTFGCASPRSWRTASTEPAAVARVVVAETAAIGVEGQPADTGDEVAIGDELAALPLRTEAEILERDQHRDREAVVDGHVLHVGRRRAGLGEGGRP